MPPYLVGAFSGVRICSDLFRFVRDVAEGLTLGLTVFSFVNLCHGLVTVGQGGSASLWGERHGVALLFWCERSGSWGEWGCEVGDSWVWRGRSGWARPAVAARGLSPPT